MLTIIPHIQQLYSWDCGISCVSMILSSLGIPVSPSEIQLFYPLKSLWTIDLAYLLKHYTTGHIYGGRGCGSLDFSFYTLHIGLNWDWGDIPFYKEAFVLDVKRVHSLFARAKDQGVTIINVGLSLDDIKRFLASNRYAIIMLVNLNLLKCHLCKERQRQEKWNETWSKWVGCCSCGIWGMNQNSRTNASGGEDDASSNLNAHRYSNSVGYGASSYSSSTQDSSLLDPVSNPISIHTPPSTTTSPIIHLPTINNNNNTSNPNQPISIKPQSTDAAGVSSSHPANQYSSSSTALSFSAVATVVRRLSFGGTVVPTIGPHHNHNNHHHRPQASVSSSLQSSSMMGGGVSAPQAAVTCSSPLLNTTTAMNAHSSSASTSTVAGNSSFVGGGGNTNSGNGTATTTTTTTTAYNYSSGHYARTRASSGSLLSVFSASGGGNNGVPGSSRISRGRREGAARRAGYSVLGGGGSNGNDRGGGGEEDGVEFIGHYIVLIGYDCESEMVFYRDPGCEGSLCAIGIQELGMAYRCRGTDMDLIVVKIL